MKNITIIVFSVFSLFVCACKSKPEDPQVEDRLKGINQGLTKILSSDEIKGAKFSIIVPTAGCGGCIDNALSYLKKRIGTMNNTHVIITGIQDRKLMRLTLGEDFMKDKHVHLDTTGIFANIDILSIYPQIVYMNEGKGNEIRELDVNSSTMDVLLSQ